MKPSKNRKPKKSADNDKKIIVSKSQEQSSSDFLKKLEGYLKLIALGAGIVAALGFPAVYLNFSRFNIPSHFISYDQVVKAGLSPAVLLGLIGFYIYWAVREFKSGKSRMRFIILPIIVFMPFMVLTLPLLLAGVISVFILYGWVLLWPFAWIIAKLSGSVVSNRTLLFITIVLMAMLGVAYLILLKLTASKWIAKKSWLGNLIIPRQQKYARKVRAKAKEGLNKKKKKSKKQDDEWSYILTWLLPALLVMFIGLAYAIKGVLHLLNPDISSMFKHTHIVIFGVVNALAYFMFMIIIACSEWLESKKRSMKLKALLIIVGIFLSIFVACSSFYAYKFYPIIPHGLGGGKPEPIIIWLNSEDIPMDIMNRLSNAKFIKKGNVVKCEHIFLLSSTSENMIFADNNYPPTSGIILPRSKIKAISW